MRTALALILFCFNVPAATPFATADLWQWRTAGDARITADGQQVVYIEGWNDASRDRRCANLWLCSTSGKIRRRLTEGTWLDRRPQWSPDGSRIAYLSERGGRKQIRILRLDSREETEVASIGQPLEIAWSPDGNALAFTARVAAAPTAAPWAPPAILARLEHPVRDTAAIFIGALGGDAPRRISPAGLDCRGQPAFMPDRRAVLTAAADGAIHLIRMADGAERALTGPGSNEQPMPSPDGSKIAWLARDSRPQSYVVRKLWVMDAGGTRPRPLSGSLDRDVASPQWSPDSRTVYFLADDRGSTHVYAARNNGTLRQVTSAPERLRGLSLADNGSAVTVRSTAGEPEAVVVFDVFDSRKTVTLALPDANLLDTRDPGEVEEIEYGSGGHPIQAWLVKPPGFSSARKYPLLVDVSVDPREMYGWEFQLRARVFAAHGFVVLCANPRGTPGYGEEFGSLLRTRFPGDDFEDLMRGVDFVLARGYIDPKRLAISGGLLAAWAIGHTDRFAADVARRPIVDWTAYAASSPEAARRAARWMGALPWEDPEQYVAHSPIYFARNFKTPSLVLAGDSDPQSTELYNALRARKVDATLVRMPGTERPSDRVLEFDTVLGWLGSRLGAPREPRP